MTKLIQSTKFKKLILFTSGIIILCFAMLFLIGNSDYFLSFASFVCIIVGLFFIIEAINVSEATPIVSEEVLDEDARWRVVGEHIIDCMFGDKVIHILESEFTIQRVNSTTEESQAKLWDDVLDLMSNKKYFGNTLNELKKTFTIKNK